jgi:hypothetical protein
MSEEYSEANPMMGVEAKTAELPMIGVEARTAELLIIGVEAKIGIEVYPPRILSTLIGFSS